jgi:hypothetical protein
VEFPGQWTMAGKGATLTVDAGKGRRQGGIRRTARVRACVTLMGTGPYGLTRDAEEMRAGYGVPF